MTQFTALDYWTLCAQLSLSAASLQHHKVKGEWLFMFMFTGTILCCSIRTHTSAQQSPFPLAMAVRPLDQPILGCCREAWAIFFLNIFYKTTTRLPSRASEVLLSEIIFFHGLKSGKEKWGEKRAYYPSRTITDFSGLGQDFIFCIMHDSGALRALFSMNTACLS